MESSDFTPRDTSAGANEGTGSGMNGGASGMNSGASGMGSGSTGSDATSGESGGIADRARGAVGTAGEKLGDLGSTVRDRAGSAKDSLVNALETGAEKLRARAGDGSMAGAGAMGGSMAVSDDRMAQVTSKVAGGMEGAADWLRDADIASLKSSVETQVKEHPGRTLLIAVGLGYLLGKALRK